MTDSTRERIAVLGGGPSGLTAALNSSMVFLSRAGLIPHCYPLIAGRDIDRILVDLADVS